MCTGYHENVKCRVNNTHGLADITLFSLMPNNLRSDVYKLDIDQLKNVPSNLSNLKSKTDKLDADKLVPVPVDLNKLSGVVKNDIVKKMYIILTSKLLKIKYLYY